MSVALDRGPFQLAAACDGICEIGLTPLAGERALALWNAPEGSWAQRFDLALASSVDSKIFPRVPECRASITRLEAAFVGEAPASSPSRLLAPAAPYFVAGGHPIPDPLAPSKQAADERRLQLWCGEPGGAAWPKPWKTTCEVWFSGKGDPWQLVDHECNGD